MLLALGRLPEARSSIERATEIDAKTLTLQDPSRAETLRLAADLDVAERRPGAAIPRYERALELIEKARGNDSADLYEPLLGLAFALVDTGDAVRAVSTAERVIALAGAHRMPADRDGAAQFSLARARWALGKDRAGALVLARATRARLAALSHAAPVLPEIDRWLAGAVHPG